MYGKTIAVALALAACNREKVGNMGSGGQGQGGSTVGVATMMGRADF